ncbi:MAG TPA: hypothetical protein PLI73_02550, partial [Candidatus Cloacimonadota bacterium]|nr:hypothetical protein [Candidatus Cloacimonadota bacterium]
MILHLAFKNIINNGWRSLINVLVITIVLIIMVWTQAMYYSWIRLAEIQQSDWEYGKGMLRVKSYDPYDPLTYEDSYAPVPAELRAGIIRKEIVPIMLAPASIYPQGRMQAAVIKGIPDDQVVLAFPGGKLSSVASDMVPVLIGTAMAKSTRLQPGDIFSIRIRDINGTYNAIDAVVEDVLSIPAPSADISTIWVNLEMLEKIRGAEGMASYFVLGSDEYQGLDTKDFRYIDKDEYFADLYQMLDNERSQQVLM